MTNELNLKALREWLLERKTMNHPALCDTLLGQIGRVEGCTGCDGRGEVFALEWVPCLRCQDLRADLLLLQARI
jgi:hypothetical protein